MEIIISVEQIEELIESGVIKYERDYLCVKFPDGAAIGGVLADNKKDLAVIIRRCLGRADFSTNIEEYIRQRK